LLNFACYKHVVPTGTEIRFEFYHGVAVNADQLSFEHMSFSGPEEAPVLNKQTLSREAKPA